MQRPPVLFRLMLGTLFLPIMLAIAAFICGMLLYAPEEFLLNQTILFGLPIMWYVYILLTLPFALWVWILLTGNWRRPVLTAAIFYFTFSIVMTFGFIEPHTPPDKRMISLYGTAGTDVYCNGVLLGQLPLKIRVDELIAKVPEWDSPPEQRWYDDSELSAVLFTWLPWDDFIKERYEASQELAETRNSVNVNVQRALRAWRDSFNKHQAGCRYWWSYRYGDTQMLWTRDESRRYYSRSSTFDDQHDYYSYRFGESFSPSLGFHVQFLADVLPELSPEQKEDWDQYVLDNWQLLGQTLSSTLGREAVRYRTRDNNDSLAQLYETALHSTARLKYALSDPPTEEDARRLLAEWVKESYRNPMFHFGWGRQNLRLPAVMPGTLLPADDIHEVMQKPLIEQWRKNKFRTESGWAPVAYYSARDKSPDYFADFARYSATSDNARGTLLENEAPQTAALLRTLLYRRSLYEIFERQINLYGGKIGTYAPLDNPVIEAEMRDFIITALTDPNHTEWSRRNVNQAVSGAIANRTHREGVDKEELAAWVSSLPMPAASKNASLRALRIQAGEALTFADRLHLAAGWRVTVETELTLDDASGWFAENPEGTFQQFLDEQEENIVVGAAENNMGIHWEGPPMFFPGSFDSMYEQAYLMTQEQTRAASAEGLPVWFVRALLHSDTPAGDPQVRDIIRQIWKDALGASVIEQALMVEYTAANFRNRDFLIGSSGSNNVPEYILDLYLAGATMSESEVGDPAPMPGTANWTNLTSFAPVLALCDSPKAGEILERWSGAAGLSPRIERSWDLWQTRQALRQRRVEVFEDLAAGRMSPDDFLFPQPKWVWKDGEYVQE